MGDEIIKSSVEKIDDEVVLNYFKDKRVLLLLPEASIRVTIRKILAYVGIPTMAIEIAESYEDALFVMKRDAPNIVVTNDQLGRKSGLDLLKLHIELRPNRKDALFCLISTYKSMLMSSEEGEQDVEMLLTRPFTYDDFKNQFLQYFKAKMWAASTIDLLESGKEQINLGNWEEAQKILTQAKEVDANAQVYYYLAVVARYFDQDDLALNYLQQSLEMGPDNLKAMLGTIDLLLIKRKYEEAQQLVARLVQKYPVSPHRIADFMKLAIVTKSYDYVLKYCEMLKDIPVFDPEMIKGVVAGLAVGAKQLISQGKNGLAQECLEQASRYCVNYPKILTNVVGSYLELGEVGKADNLLARIVEDENTPVEKHILNLEIIYKVGESRKALMLALALLRKKVHEKKVFEIAIECSIKINRNKESIIELIQDGCVKFPELDSYYQQLEQLSE